MSKKNLPRGLLCLLVLTAVSGCTQSQVGSEDPKKQLTHYISKSFSIEGPQDRRDLLGYLTGDAKTRLAAWSDDQFKQAFVDTKRQFVKLAIQDSKSVSPIEVELTYELTYLDQSKGRDAKVTNRKMAQLIQTQGQWLISEVRNIKELVEYRDEMSLP